MNTRKKASWIDERNMDRGNLRVGQAFSKLRADAAYDQADTCAECKLERDATGDVDALCDDHMAHALGMNSRWP